MIDQPSARNGWRTWIEAFRVAVTGPGVLFLVFAAGCFGIYYAKALLSIFTGVIFGVALFNGLFDRTTYQALGRYRGFIALMAIVLVYVISGIHSDDTRRWARLAWESIPYATIPLGFYVYRNEASQTWRRLLLIFIGVSALSALSVMIDYALHFDAYNALYKVGKTIPTPIIHVRYSFFMALAACIAFALWYEIANANSNSNSNTNANAKTIINTRNILLSSVIFLTIVVHVLAVRTGLIALYGGIAVMLAFIVFRDRRWKLGIVSVIVVIAFVFIAYQAFPSVANKIGYVMYDLRMMKEQGALAEYSDNVRITSIRHGLALLKDNLITGVGIGDLKAETQRMYAEKTPNFPVESRYPPISQYVFILTAFGLAGGIVFFFLLLYPLFFTRFHYVLLSIYASTLFSLIGETTIELLLGKTVFVMLVCIAMLYANTGERSTT